LFWLDKPILKNLSLSVGRNEIVAIIGANGSGKSTLFSLIHESCDRESYLIHREQLNITGTIDIAQGIIPFHLPQSIAEYENYPGNKYPNDNPGEYHYLLNSFGLEPQGENNIRLSDGQRQKMAIVAACLSDADLIMLDEPTNYLDIAGITAIENQLIRLRDKGCGILLVSHDRTLINNLADRTIYLTANGIFQTAGGYSKAWSLATDEFDARLKKVRTIKGKIERLQKEMRTRMSWSARKEKSKIGSANEKGHVSRLAAKMAARALTAQRKAEKEIERLKNAKPFIPKRLTLPLPEYNVSSKKVFSMEEIYFDYNKPQKKGNSLLQNITLTAGSHNKVCLMGTNGAGKTTLLRLILGKLNPDRGRVYLNKGIKLRYLPQGLAGFFKKEVLLDNFSCYEGNQAVIRQALGAVLLTGDKVTESVDRFSQGELMRAAIVRCLMERAEFLILDEPTSHLDIESVEVLEKILRKFKGGLLFISHDRSFVENVAQELFILDKGKLKLV
jgi:ATPase subunit of ABC transporter with duplicated ATPase domains